MKNKPLTFVTIVTLILLSFSCKYESEEALYPDNIPCDTTNLTFSGKIALILANNCLVCHSNAQAASSGNNIRLQDYADVYTMRNNISGAINRTGSFSPMPKNARKLNSCLILQFDKWVAGGAPEN